MSQVHDAAGTGRPAEAAGWLHFKKRNKEEKHFCRKGKKNPLIYARFNDVTAKSEI
jgi:hypothetical protein